MSSNTIPFPPSLVDGVRRAQIYDTPPPLTRALTLILEHARSARRQGDLREALENLRQLARVPLPTVSPAATRGLRLVRDALIDEILHGLIADADPKVTQLLDGVSALLRHIGTPAP